MTTSPFPILRRTGGFIPVALISVVIAIAGVYWLSGSIAREQYRDVVIVAVLLQAAWVLMRWRLSVYAFMVFVVIEGFLVNYFYQVPEINLLKDVFVISLFGVMGLQMVARGIFPIPNTSWNVPFLAFAMVYCLEVFNPSLPNLLVGLVGIRVNLLFFLLVPVAFWFFDSRERVLNFFRFMFLLSIPVSLFGIIQYWYGPSFMVALSPGFGRAVYLAYGLQPNRETTYFRTFSTFVHTGGFGIYLSFMMLVTIALWLVPSLRRFRPWVLGGFVIQFAALLTTGSRGSFVWFFAALSVLFLIQRSAARLLPFVMLAALLLWASVFVVGPGFVDRFSSLLNLDYVQERNVPLMYGWLMESMQTDWAGLGAGYASVASRHVGVTPLNTTIVENGLAKIRFETGLPGFILYCSFLVALMVECLRAPIHAPDPEIRILAGACGAFIFVNLVNVVIGTPFDSSPTNTYLWFFTGFLARARYLCAPGSRPAHQGATACP